MSSTTPLTRRRKVPRLMVLALLAAAFFFPVKLAICPAWTATLVNERGQPVAHCTVTESWEYFGVRGEASEQLLTDAGGRVAFPERATHMSMGLLAVARFLSALNVHASSGPAAKLSSGLDGYKWFNARYPGQEAGSVYLWNVKAETTVTPDGLATLFHLKPIDLIDVVQIHDLPAVRRFLAQDPALVRLTDETGHTALHWASLDPKDIEIARLLVASGADVNAATREGTTPLHFAVDHCALASMTLLLEHGANPDAAIHDSIDGMKNGCTPLHLVIPGWESDELKIAAIKLLLLHHADLNRRDAHGNTPLYTAAGLASPAIVRELLAAGADPAIRSNEGKTPLDVANEVKKTENRDVLKEFLARQH